MHAKYGLDYKYLIFNIFSWQSSQLTELEILTDDAVTQKKWVLPSSAPYLNFLVRFVNPKIRIYSPLYTIWRKYQLIRGCRCYRYILRFYSKINYVRSDFILTSSNQASKMWQKLSIQNYNFFLVVNFTKLFFIFILEGFEGFEGLYHPLLPWAYVARTLPEARQISQHALLFVVSHD